MSEQIIWLTPSTPPDPAVLGGKGVGLVRLIGLEAPVPSAFVVTTGAYLDHIRRTGLDERIVAAGHYLAGRAWGKPVGAEEVVYEAT